MIGRRKKIQTFLFSYLPAIVEDGPSEKDSEGKELQKRKACSLETAEEEQVIQPLQKAKCGRRK